MGNPQARLEVLPHFRNDCHDGAPVQPFLLRHQVPEQGRLPFNRGVAYPNDGFDPVALGHGCSYLRLY